ncbi:Leucine-rich repeat protein kinase family protein [Theobroma cacao]|uniref:Leucine-rich repeat protein kinase family protein n=1 Tax=Theobroma cacao TaxID=3641 RepID=A0A061FSD7_THECC|nr:Leucine-rich repeat protein kinase family protein [Theobroma cacao]
MARIIGYRAPDVIETRKGTQKSDVYSFGVLLLEEWTAEVVDEELLRFQHFQEEMVQMLQIAAACVAKTPEMRPKMDEIVRMIEDIRQPESKNRTSSEAESNIQMP